MTDTLSRLAAALADRYRIERELGAGGMATVYLAYDLKHKRKVALKVLKPELAAVLGAERFVQEITTTAALQHPHILPLFDSGQADGFLYYVMPFIDGETLRGKLDRETQLGIDEAVKLTVQVADALDYAHRNGVIHRDIKPENILLHDGRPMVADFGIALALSAAAGGRMTETGMSLGTPYYMSPEQATAAKEITGRSDIYSLASVLYEMLTGEPPHTGASAQQIIMKIIAEPVQGVTSLRRSVPPNVAAAVERGLEKLPADRFESAKAFAEALTDPAYGRGTAAFPAARGPALPATPAARWRLVGGVVMLIGLGVVAGVLVGRPKMRPPEVVRFTLETGPDIVLTGYSIGDAPFTISPDGRSIVFVGRLKSEQNTISRLYRRDLGQLDPVAIPGTDGAISPFFSPDGLWVGFTTWRDGGLKKVPLLGGPPITLATGVASVLGSATWGDAGNIAFVTKGVALAVVSASGGTPEVLSASTAERNRLWPQFLPGGRAILFESCTGGCGARDLAYLDLRTGKEKVLVPGAARGWYLPTGHLLYTTQEGAVFGVAFDLRRGEITGTAIPLFDGVMGQSNASGGSRLAVSPSGAMAYVAGATDVADRMLVVLDRAGREHASLPRPGRYTGPRFSPDGRRIAVADLVNGHSQVFLYDRGSSTLSQFTLTGENIRPSWSPDGRRLVMSANRTGQWDIWTAPADRSDTGASAVEGPQVTGGSATFWTRDGKWIVFDGPPAEDTTSEGPRSEDIFTAATSGARTRRPVIATQANEQSGEVSPDGKWVAYASDQSGNYQIYVRPFLAPGGETLISPGLGAEALWLSDHELAYADPSNDSVMVATLEMGATVRVLQRRGLFDYSKYRHGSSSQRNYDVSWDGKEIAVVRSVISDATPPLTVALHWDTELRRRMAEQATSP